MSGETTPTPVATKPTWTVNDYDAAACIASEEINRKMSEAYNATDSFPKNWQVQDPRLADKGANKGQPAPVGRSQRRQSELPASPLQPL